MNEIQRRRRAILGEKKSNPRLPAEYQEVEWIQSSGTQCISSGITENGLAKIAKYKILADVSVPSQTPGTGVIASFGAESGMWFGLISGPAIGYASQAFNIQISDRNTFEMGWALNSSNKLDGYCKCGQEEKTKQNTSPSLYSYYFSFFAAISTGGSGQTGSYRSSCRLYRGQLYKDNALVCDLIPCYRKSDSVIGMYDLVSETFQTNKGTGTFTKGADI